MSKSKHVEDAAERVVQLEEELEISGFTSTEGDALSYAQDALRKWVDTVVGVVATPGSGRVTLIHANGNQSKIASPELPYLVSKPINWAKGE